VNWNNLKENSIVLHLESTGKPAAIQEMLARAQVFKRVRDLEVLEKAILSREKVMTTGLGRGVAISHAEVPGLPGVEVALGLSKKGIEFDAVDGKPVHILFVVVNSKLKRAEYLEVLSTLTKLMRKEQVRKEMLCCSSSGDVEKVLHNAALPA
jgi:mannitol/fructose-specific phosphotransferase system IIA component (Ntr-type)